MAPEQAEDTHSADARADIYSLGCTLYRLLSGEVLYGGDSVVKKILAHRGADMPLRTVCPAAPAALEATYRKMVAKKAADRQQTMADVVAELEGVAREMVRSPGAPAQGDERTVDLKFSEFLSGLSEKTSKSATVTAKTANGRSARHPGRGHLANAPSRRQPLPTRSPPPPSSVGDPAPASRPSSESWRRAPPVPPGTVSSEGIGLAMSEQLLHHRVARVQHFARPAADTACSPGYKYRPGHRPCAYLRPAPGPCNRPFPSPGRCWSARARPRLPDRCGPGPCRES